MEKHKIITGETEDEIWKQISADLADISYPLMYNANIRYNDKTVFLNIENDPGGGFESGFQSTIFTAAIPVHLTFFSSQLDEQKGFRLALHDENFIDKLGKFFGIEDVQTGFEEFDKKLIIKTNDVEKVRILFADEKVREVFQMLGSFNLHVAHYDHVDRHSALELTIDRDILNIEELRKIYIAFVSVLNAFEKGNNAFMKKSEFDKS